jgi:peroxiredoxin
VLPFLIEVEEEGTGKGSTVVGIIGLDSGGADSYHRVSVLVGHLFNLEIPMAIEVGERAPDFALQSRPTEVVRLGDYLGKESVVLLFFPLAYSSVCTDEMCQVAEDYSAYRDLGAQVLGISVDSPFVNQKFAEDCKAPFPILSDFNKEAIAAYGVLREDLIGLKGVSNRAAFVIDRDGKVTYAWVTQNPHDMPPFDEIKGALRGA